MSHLRSSLVLLVIFLFVNNNFSNGAILCANLKSVSAGETHTLALSDDNSLWVCGSDEGDGIEYGYLLGLGNDVTSSYSLKQVHGEDDFGYLNNIVSYDAGWLHSLAADSNTLWSWGYDDLGQLGNGPGYQDWEFPQKVHGVNDIGYLSDTNHIVYVSAGRSGKHSLAVDSNGYVFAWGNNDSGQCGDGVSGGQRNYPVCVLDDNALTTNVYLGDIAHIIKVDAGINHSIALDSNGGHVWHWGTGSALHNAYPQQVKASSAFGGQPLSNIVGISSCGHSVAVDTNGNVWEWTSGTKSNNAYMVPHGDMDTNSNFLENIAEVSASFGRSMARTNDGHVLIWDVNQNEHPVYVPDGEMNTPSGLLEGIISISEGYYDFKVAVSADGRGWGWGVNNYGELGVGDFNNRTEPAEMNCAEVSDSNGIIYVDKDATEGLNDGNSWDNAYQDFNDALNEAEICVPRLGSCEIWVAAGTYKPSYEGTNYSQATFKIPPGNIAIMGHFGGIGTYEASPNERDFNNPEFETIFDGNVGPTGQKASYVVTCDDIGVGLLLDGFTITHAGQRGLYINYHSDPSIKRCKFNGNSSYGIYAYDYSNPDITDSNFFENGTAGIYSYNSSWPYVKNCVFDGNNHNSYGLQSTYSEMIVEDCIIKRYASYGINSSYSPHLEITGCKIEDNTGSGIYCSDSYLEATGCIIKNNGKDGIRVVNASSLTITNNLISQNRDNGIYIEHCGYIFIKNNWIYLNGDGSPDSGLYLKDSISAPFVHNNTIVENAPFGIYIDQGRDPCLVNDIIWQNSTNIYSERGNENIIASYCCIEGGFQWGTEIIDSDPCFVKSDVNNFHLKPISDCKNAGDPNADYTGEMDIDGEPRVADGRAEIGGDEVYWPKADYDVNEIVNFVDFAFLAGSWEDINAPDISLDNDNDVDIDDLAIFCDDWLWIAPWSDLYAAYYGDSEDMGMYMMFGGPAGLSGMVPTISESPVLTEEMTYESAEDEQMIEDYELTISPEQMEELITWTENLWQSDPNIQAMIPYDDLQCFIDKLKEQL